MSFSVRNARKEDYNAVKRIMNQVQQMHVDWRPDIYKANDDMISEEIYENMIQGGNLYVAVGDRVVGVMELVYKHIETPAHVTRDVIFIDSMAVDEGFRGQGIGHLFFDKVKELKASSGADAVELVVNAKNRAAYEMYTKYGFAEKSITMEMI